jgi:hypothetical protein
MDAMTPVALLCTPGAPRPLSRSSDRTIREPRKMLAVAVPQSKDAAKQWNQNACGIGRSASTSI